GLLLVSLQEKRNRLGRSLQPHPGAGLVKEQVWIFRGMLKSDLDQVLQFLPFLVRDQQARQLIVGVLRGLDLRVSLLGPARPGEREDVTPAEKRACFLGGLPVGLAKDLDGPVPGLFLQQELSLVVDAPGVVWMGLLVGLDETPQLLGT